MLYHVVERPQFAVPYVTGPEYQLIDEPNFPEPLEEWQKLGVDYAMHLPDKSKMKVNPTTLYSACTSIEIIMGTLSFTSRGLISMVPIMFSRSITGGSLGSIVFHVFSF